MNRPRNLQIEVPITGYKRLSVASEAVTIPAGAVGSVVNFYILQKPITDSTFSYVGGKGDTSISVTANTIFTEEVSYKEDENLENGQYWIDYITGKGRGKKASTATTITVDYSVFQNS